MQDKILVTLRAVALIACISCAATAERYESPRGYSLEYPSGWRMAERGQLNAISRDSGEANAALATQVDAAIYDPAAEGFAPNINIVVRPGMVDTSKANIDKEAALFAKQMTDMGSIIEELRSEVIIAAGRKCISLHGRFKTAEDAPALSNWTVIVPGMGASYTLTCTASAGMFESLQPAFESAINSFQLNETNTTPSIYRSRPFTMGIMAGIFAGIVCGYMFISHKKKKY